MCLGNSILGHFSKLYTLTCCDDCKSFSKVKLVEPSRELMKLQSCSSFGKHSPETKDKFETKNE